MSLYNEIAGMIDHSLLKPMLTDKEIIEGCRVADEYGVASVCVRPSDVILAKELLKESSVLVTTVIGFPHGSSASRIKMEEAKEAIKNGAAELDMVLNIGKLKSGKYEYVRDEIAMIVKYAHSMGVKVKIIFENCYLTNEEIIKACKICNEAGPDWVKTSTGFGSGGAVDEHIKLMREHCRPEIQIKAAGGVRTLERALEIKKLGCTRFGATATVEILKNLK
ncbi:MAG TPA: deoxyribose-phosphate aldolase [Ignavibacteriaceae bacterium]|nr:deoxyribose-phosphate aldolase [Ignavibacteriaceae bacterium]